MSSTRRKEKLKAGLDGLFSKPAAKKPIEPIEPPAVEEPIEPVEIAEPAAPPAVINKINGTSGQSGRKFEPEEQVVVFTMGDEYYAVDIAVVESIIKMQEITAVPNAPDGVEGVVNLRGLVLPVICLRVRLDMPRVPPGKDTRIVVVEINDAVVGCIVDTVTEVLRIPADRVEPPSALMASFDSVFIRGVAKIDERLIILIDLDKLLVLQ